MDNIIKSWLSQHRTNNIHLPRLYFQVKNTAADPKVYCAPGSCVSSDMLQIEMAAFTT